MTIYYLNILSSALDISTKNLLLSHAAMEPFKMTQTIVTPYRPLDQKLYAIVQTMKAIATLV